MNIYINCIGKINKKSSEYFLIEEYTKRLKWNIKINEFNDETKEKEAKNLLEAIPNNSLIIALDEIGKELTSKEFANYLNEKQMSYNNISFLIGGADGLSQTIIDKSHFVLSLSKMTWPHKIVRILLAEQLYRAYSILHNHPYHRGNNNRV
ncbi:MAG: 23S rRNA (pseudouridine(1915)-N(3))-methyltransferase RlmH [Sphingobacteriia bacterium]|nr:23S rRNA (pseudouridine(1915)-N(3))-methyltransferase RlmH [Sphingobacteriia bacterium]